MMRRHWVAVGVLLACGLLLASRSIAEDPPYPHGAFRADCQICHQGKSWRPANAGPEFDHAQFGFPLTGAHPGAPCMACHMTLAFDAVRGNACADCHSDVHAGEMGVQCEQCHTTRSFVDRADEVRSHRLTRFPLTGAHLSLDCISCHPSIAGGLVVFAGTPTDCAACHLAEFRSTSSPDHVSAGFSTDCAACHRTTVWSGTGGFDHALTGFPLTGGHAGLDCAACHSGASGGTFGPLDSACFACHADDYAVTSNPNHAAAGFPTDCVACHGTVTWSGAIFDHDASNFPIYSGRHRGEWTSCTTCHTNPASYQVFTCFACHPHSDREKTDGDHREESGYIYDSNACYNCHPRGNS